jgi:uncharacterized protein DUF973
MGAPSPDSLPSGYGAPAASPTSGEFAWPAVSRDSATGAYPAGSGPGISADVRAMEYVATAAVLAIVGYLLSTIGGFVWGVNAVTGPPSYTCNQATNTCSLTGLALTEVAGLFGLVVVGVILGILSLLKYRAGFRALAPADRRFRSPGRGATLALFGITLVLIGYVFLFAFVANVYGSCASGSYASCSGTLNASAGLLGAALGFLVIGAILGLIGLILVLMGIWRLGQRYNESMFKIGAVLTIIPWVNIVGAFLIYLGTRHARERLSPH